MVANWTSMGEYSHFDNRLHREERGGESWIGEERKTTQHTTKNYNTFKSRNFFFFNFLNLTKRFPGEIEMGASLRGELHRYMKACWHDDASKEMTKYRGRRKGQKARVSQSLRTESCWYWLYSFYHRTTMVKGAKAFTTQDAYLSLSTQGYLSNYAVRNFFHTHSVPASALLFTYRALSYLLHLLVFLPGLLSSYAS